MKGNSWLVLLLVFVLAYFIGVKFPTTGQSLLTSAGL